MTELNPMRDGLPVQYWRFRLWTVLLQCLCVGLIVGGSVYYFFAEANGIQLIRDYIRFAMGLAHLG